MKAKEIDVEKLRLIVERVQNSPRSHSPRSCDEAELFEALPELVSVAMRYDALHAVVERMSKHGNCAAFDGSGEFRFIGCEIFRSDDPEEYCLRCGALAALETVKAK